MIYLKSTTSPGRAANDKLTIKENAVIYLLASLPLIITLITRYILNMNIIITY